MPELPEVHVVAQRLHQSTTGRKIIQINVFDSKLRNPDFNKLIGLQIRSVFRVGKLVVFCMTESAREKNTYLAVHLRMTGRLIWFAENEMNDIPKHRLSIVLKGGMVVFCDTRRFGTVSLFDNLCDFSPKGCEPLDDVFTKNKLVSLLNASRQGIKNWLLRQDKIVGLGNIYVCEILFKAEIGPRRSCSSLTDLEINRLYRAIGYVLKRAIQSCDHTFADFQSATHELGKYQQYLQVYKRAGQPCLSCGVLIQKMVQQQRTTYYCPQCQA